MPILHDSFVSEKEKRAIGPQMCSSLAATRLSTLNLFDNLTTIGTQQALGLSSQQQTVEEFEEHFSRFCGSCVGSPVNQNLTGPQKEILLWLTNY